MRFASKTALVVSSAALAAFSPSCSDEGPAPRIDTPSTAAPAVVCPACESPALRTFAVTGAHFAPIAEDVADGTASVAAPAIRLVDADGVKTTVPEESVEFTQTEDGTGVATVTLPQDLVPPLADGDPEALYDLVVENPGGRASKAVDAVRAVPPDAVLELAAIDPPFAWTGAPTAVTITSNGGFASTPTASMALHGTADAAPVALENVAFVDESTLSAVVPAGAPVGVYDVTVVNPAADGRVGILESGFEVVSQPVPNVLSIVPERGTSQADTAVAIFGDDFRAPVAVDLIGSDGAVAWSTTGLTPTDAHTIETVFPTKTQSAALPAGAYLVRVTDEDEGTYSTYSAFLVTNPAGNLNPFEATGSLTTGRRRLAGAFGRDVLGNGYVYAIGGDGGEGTAPLGSVEVSQLSKFGALGDFRTQANGLGVARAAAAAIAVPVYDAGSDIVPSKTYLYVVGGSDGSGSPLDSVERAVLLDPGDAPTDLEATASGGSGALESGAWYYQVAAVLSADDPDNPGGETLPSEEAVVALGAAGSVALAWQPVEVDGLAAASYRVYRTDAPDGVSKTEHLIAEVSGTSYVDGGDAPGTASPAFLGATGVFVPVASALGAPRFGLEVVVAHDETGARFAVALGGVESAAGGPVDAVEIASIGDDGALGDFSADGAVALDAPRAFFDAVVEDGGNVSTFAGSGSRLWALGGIDDSGDVTGAFASSDVSGGGNGAWTVNGKTVQAAAGVMAVIANDKMFCLGGASTADGLAFSDVTPNGRDADFDEDGDITGSVNSTANGLEAPRAFGAAVQGAGFIYFIGGTSDGADALSTAERTF